jgi:hypothetical protein
MSAASPVGWVAQSVLCVGGMKCTSVSYLVRTLASFATGGHPMHTRSLLFLLFGGIVGLGFWAAIATGVVRAAAEQKNE